LDAEIGPNAAAGRVEINVNADLRRSLEDSISDVRARGQASIDTVQDALNDVRDLPDRARTAARNANFNANAALAAARERAGDTANTVRERAGDAAESVSAAPENARQRAAQGAQNAAVSAEANAVAASERMNDLVQRAELEAQRARRDAELPSVPRGFVTESEFSPLSDTADRVREARQRGELAARRARRDFEVPTVPRGFRGDLDTDDPAFTPDDSGQRPELYQSDADDVGNGLLQLRRTGSDSRSNAPTRAESDTDSRRADQRSGLLDRAESDIDGLAESAQQPSVVGPGVGGGGSERTTSPVNELGQGFETDFAVGTVFESSFGQGQRISAGTAVGQSLGPMSGAETRTGFESRSETRSETRTEVETGTRTERRFERRFEADFGGEDDDEDREFPTAAPSFESVEFRNAVATPAAVLGVGSLDSASGDSGGGLDEDEFDVSGGLL